MVWVLGVLVIEVAGALYLYKYRKIVEREKEGMVALKVVGQFNIVTYGWVKRNHYNSLTSSSEARRVFVPIEGRRKSTMLVVAQIQYFERVKNPFKIITKGLV